MTRRATLALFLFFVAWHLSLAIGCHESSFLWRPRRGGGTELLIDLFAFGCYFALAILPLSVKRGRRPLALVCWPLLAIALFLRALDWAIYFYSGAHASVLVVTHTEGTALSLVRGAVPIGCVTAGLVASLGISTLLVLALRRDEDAGRLRWVALALLIVIVPLLSGRMRRPRGEHATTNPEWSFGRSVAAWLHERSCVAGGECSVQLRETTRDKLRRFGIHVAPKEAMPLFRARTFSRPLSFPRTASWRPRRNVIVIFFESLSAELVGAYRENRRAVTPNLDRFAAASMMVTGYYNATTPTVVSLVAALCSIYPPTGHEEFGEAYYGALDCASNVLGPRGWESIFVRGIEQSYANVGPFLRSQGFTVRDRADIARSLDEGSQSWGYSDPQLFRYLRKLLTERGDTRPLFLGMTTVDLHAPYPVRPVPRLFDDRPGGVLLDVVHASDEAFGAFWDWFQASPYAKDTILVVTGDHPIFPHAEYVQLRGPTWEKSYYDEIPLIVYDPGIELPHRLELPAASSVDLLPTILHLLDVDVPNPFEGNSLFDDRRGQDAVLGDQTDLLWSRQPDGDGHLVIRNFHTSDCDAAEDVHGAMLTPCEQIEWHHWKERLVHDKRIWRAGLRY